MSDDTNFVATEPVPCVFMQLFEAKPFKRNGKVSGKPKFKAAFVLDPASEDFKTIKGIAARIAKATWPGRELKTLKFPWSEGDDYVAKVAAKKPDKADAVAWAKGKILLRAFTGEEFPMQLSGIENGNIVDYDSEAQIAKAKAKFYNGVNCYFEINLKDYDVGNEGVTAYLSKVLTTGKGERKGGAGGAQSSKATFSKYIGKVSAEDPTDGIDDEDDF